MIKDYKNILLKDVSNLDSFYLVFSEEQYLLDKFEREFKEKFISQQTADFNLSYLQEEDQIFQKIVSKSNTVPMMSEKRFIIVKGVNVFDSKLDDFELFKNFVDKIPNFTTLIILINKDLSSNNKLKKIKEAGTIIKLNPPQYGNLNSWIKNQFAKRNKEIDYSSINFLEKMFNNNLQQLDSEINKICTYLDNKDLITVSDIKAVITKDRSLKENIIFEFLDSFSERKRKKCLYLFQQMIENGKVPELIFAMIIRRVKLMLIINSLKDKGLNPDTIAKKIDQHPYPVKKIYRYVKSYNNADLESLLQDLLKVDIRVKTGREDIINGILNTLTTL